MDLSIIVVSYNTSGLLRQCLTSIFENAHSHYSAEVIVIDNASKDGSAEMVREEFPGITLRANSENRGFAAANNQGLKLSRGRFTVLLNPDTEVIGPALWQMLGFLEATPWAGVVCPALLYPDHSFQEGAFHFPRLAQLFFELFPLNWRLLRSGLNGRYPRDWYKGSFPQAFEIDFGLGACLMFRREVIEQTGGLDERFFMYMEEIDWCYRIKASKLPPGRVPPGFRFGSLVGRFPKWKIYCLPEAKIIHHAGASSRQFREEMFYQLYRSRFLFYRKHYSPIIQEAARLIIRLGISRLGLETVLQHYKKEIEKGEFEARKKAYSRVWEL